MNDHDRDRIDDLRDTCSELRDICSDTSERVVRIEEQTKTLRRDVDAQETKLGEMSAWWKKVALVAAFAGAYFKDSLTGWVK